MSSNNRINFYDLLALCVFAMPTGLLLLPVHFFDTGQSLCVSKLVFDVECYGCGLTRAVMHLLHFDFVGAWEFNKLVILAFPMMVWLFFSLTKETIKRSTYLKSKLDSTKLYSLLMRVPTIKY